MNHEEFHRFLKEQKLYKNLTTISKLISISFLVIYLYLLFSSSYTASPLIVVINYLAIFTGFSGLIRFKYFEIPSILLSVSNRGLDSPFYHLNVEEKKYVWRKAGREEELPTDPNPDWIVSTLQLHDRFPWKSVGKFYLVFYLVVILISVYYLTSVYLETGFQN
ncbi:hypothetical protein EHQ92_13365 [Leptospira biflexa]|uniref:hypothetical protein n=1 Tax=Leptospira biflexa TaxID=172 RepID=UPI0010911A74|nr:hypothetical protein [Leptospira biflexa]TGM44620.1 hypothetical protein EHQ92_13365 [Leptospira biflexa]TGM45338.1 hypothetical protein EHQ88_14135 [Leptospira biflexa]